MVPLKTSSVGAMMTKLPTRPKVVGFDLDGTLLEHKTFPELGKPIPGMKEQVDTLRMAGWKIAVWTCRNAEGWADIREHLEKHGIKVDYINENPHESPSTSPKVYFDVYVDDRGIGFRGDVQGLAASIINFKPWHKEGP
jgi:hypothetical protein